MKLACRFVSLLFLFLAGCGPSVVRESPTVYKAPPPAPPKGPLIVIDPGHGGKDAGTHSETPEYQEKALTLKTAFILESYLQRLGYRTVMTRTRDEFISLAQRADVANQLNAKLFVSIHYNSAQKKTIEGIEVFFFESKKNKDRSDKSKQLAKGVLDQLIAGTKAKSRGVKHGNFHVIRETNMPAILVEGGFLTHAKEREKIFQRQYIEALAQAIAKGVDQYIKCPRRDLNARPSA